MHKSSRAFIGLLVWSALASSAQAHIKLLKPDSWLNEDSSGAPQKGGPCGPGSFDDVQPVPMSMKVTTVTAGDTIMVEFDETVHHPGWFRIALAEDPNDFEEIEFPNANNCEYDMAKVPSEPHGNVLADGLGKDTNLGGPNREFKEMIKLPDTACEKCTLQVIQVMADALHAPPGCVYYHCAELKILPKDGAAAAAGSGGSAAAGSSAASAGASGATAGKAGSTAASPAAGSGSAGMSAGHAHAGASGAVKPTMSAATAGSDVAGRPAITAGMSSQAATGASESSGGGCSVAGVGSRSGFALGGLWVGLAALWLTRRKLRA